MTWPQDPSATAKHTCHHDNGEPLSEKDQHLYVEDTRAWSAYTEPHPTRHNRVSAAELELEDGDPIAVEVFTDHPVDGGVPRSETLKIEILKGDEARASHKTVQTRLDKAEALQIDRVSPSSSVNSFARS